MTALGLSYGMRALAPWPGIEPRPPALGAQSLGHWTTRFLIYTVCALLLSHVWFFVAPWTIAHCMLSCFSHVQLFVTLWTVAHQTPLSMGSVRQGYWSGLPWPLPAYVPSPGTEPVSLASSASAGRFFTTSATVSLRGSWWWLKDGWGDERRKRPLSRPRPAWSVCLWVGQTICLSAHSFNL